MADAERLLLGQSVITSYNNKTYKIDELDFNQSPKNTFTNDRGETMSFIDYYKNQHGITIKDPDQPLLMHRLKKKAEEEKDVTKIICLVPELCLMTGMTDEMKADFKIMSEVAKFTRVTPDNRQLSTLEFVKRIKAVSNEVLYMCWIVRFLICRYFRVLKPVPSCPPGVSVLLIPLCGSRLVFWILRCSSLARATKRW